MNIKTHCSADGRLLGTPLEIEDDSRAVVLLKTTGEMVVDETGLVHGGFAFGVADYAAMLAVNHPNVVLAEANVRFTAPVVAGQDLRAEARVVDRDENRRTVSVSVKVAERSVMEGEFLCIVLREHVLRRRR